MGQKDKNLKNRKEIQMSSNSDLNLQQGLIHRLILSHYI